MYVGVGGGVGLGGYNLVNFFIVFFSCFRPSRTVWRGLIFVFKKLIIWTDGGTFGISFNSIMFKMWILILESDCLCYFLLRMRTLFSDIFSITFYGDRFIAGQF